MKVLNHIGITCANPGKLVQMLVGLGICEVKDANQPYLLAFSCGGTLQLHQGENPTGIKPAIEVEDIKKFCQLLEANGISFQLRSPGIIDFVLCDIPFHTVSAPEKKPVLHLKSQQPKMRHRHTGPNNGPPKAS